MHKLSILKLKEIAMLNDNIVMKQNMNECSDH